MDEASQLCDRLVMMNDSRIIAAGSPTELVTQYAIRDVIEIKDASEELIRSLPNLLGKSEYFEKADDLLYIYTHNAALLAEKLRTFNPSEILERRANLEDVFLKLAGRSLNG